MSAKVYVAHTRVDGRTVSLLNPDGNRDTGFAIDFCAPAKGVKKDSAGNFYVFGLDGGKANCRKLDASLATVYTLTTYAVYCNAIAIVEGSNALFTGAAVTSGSDSNPPHTQKWDLDDGGAVWNGYSLPEIKGLAVNPAGTRIVSVGDTNGRTPVNSIYVNSSTGSTSSSGQVNSCTDLRAIAIIDNSNAYVVGARTSSRTLWKCGLTSPYTVAWYADHGAALNCVCIDSAGNVLVAGASDGTYTTRKYNSSGTLLWSADHGGTVHGIAVDGDDYVYTTGDRISNVTTRKYDPDGNLVWSGDAGAYSYGLWVEDVVVTDAEPPGLAFAFGPTVPVCTFSVRTALALPFALAGPETQIQFAPDLALAPREIRQVYRLYEVLDGGALREIPLASLQCTRRVGASTWLSIECPGSVDLDLGVTLLLKAGYALSDGTETLGEFLRAIATERAVVRHSAGTLTTLTGRVQNPSYRAQTRTLQGVFRRGAENGKRACECAIDPLLRPNDTVHDGESTWLAGAIAYRLSPSAGTMHVREA